MGYKGFIRSVGAEMRRQEREAKRSQRELERQRREYEKMQEHERARFEVQEFENRLDVVTSLHKDCGPTWDWQKIQDEPRPAEPQRDWYCELETKARKAAAEYKPSRADRLLRRIDSKREALVASIEAAVAGDNSSYLADLDEHRLKLKEWQDLQGLAIGILAGDPSAYIEAIKSTDPFSEISELGSGLRFTTEDARSMQASLHVHGEQIIPSESKSLLKSGKLSTKKMTKTRFYELYQDHVCSSVLRIARELFALLPLQTAFVTATADLLNTSTGHIEQQPIISLAMPRKTVALLNFDALDPSDAMQNFVHNMQFLKTKGFQVVNRIQPDDILLDS